MWYSRPDPSSPQPCVDFCSTLYKWATMAQLCPNDYFLSFRSRSSPDTTHKLSYRELGKAVKKIAIHFNMDPWFFSCYSMRVGGASLLQAAGAPDGFIMMMGRWKTLPNCLRYQANSSSAQDRMMRVLTTANNIFTTRDIELASTRLPTVTQSRAA